jgi:hypothetical protein
MLRCLLRSFMNGGANRGNFACRGILVNAGPNAVARNAVAWRRLNALESGSADALASLRQIGVILRTGRSRKTHRTEMEETLCSDVRLLR